MAESIVQRKSFEFVLEVICLYRKLQAQKEYVLSKQLLWSGLNNELAHVEELIRILTAIDKNTAKSS